MDAVTTKARMYRLLAAGAFGNTLPVWFDLDTWEAEHDRSIPLWGIRSGLGGGDKRMRLNVPREEVAALYRQWFPTGGGNVSPMIDRWVTLRAEAFECDFGHPFGLNVFFADGYDPADPWRGSFRKYGRPLHGVAADHLLRRHLWSSDYEDLRVLLECYPSHVVEFSACSRAVGVVPHRNTVIWEVRRY